MAKSASNFGNTKRGYDQFIHNEPQERERENLFKNKFKGHNVKATGFSSFQCSLKSIKKLRNLHLVPKNLCTY